jgi:hypothetical protein
MPKVLTHPVTGRTFHLGRRRPLAQCPRLCAKNYIRGSLPAAPATVDFSSYAPKSSRDIYLNDQLGCCVISGYYHLKGIWTGGAGNEFVASDQQIASDYRAIGGPGDNGCNEQDALNYWTQRGDQGGAKLMGWLAVDATNQQEIQSCIWLFENIYFGTEMPDSWVNPMPQGDGFVWDVAGGPDPGNGHCYIGYGFDATGVKINTWAMLGTVTYKAVASYNVDRAGGELYVLLSPDQIAKAASRAPNGFNWHALISDFDAIGGNVPVPPAPVFPIVPGQSPIPTPA